MPREIRIGIIGMGPRGIGWVRNTRHVPNLRLAAVCDKIQARLEAGLQAANDADVKGYRDAESMLRDARLDAVAVVVAPEDQPDLIVLAAESGRHVICDVPLCYELEECWKITVAVERAGVRFQMAKQRTWSPFVEAWRKFVVEARLGHVLFVEGEYLHGIAPDQWWMDPKSGRRISWEEATRRPDSVKTRYWNIRHPITYHTTDLSPILRILDDRVTRVVCMSTRPRSYYFKEVLNPDIEVALMRTEKDTLIRLAAGFTFPTAQPWHWWHILGTEGELETHRKGPDDGVHGAGKWWFANAHMPTRMDMQWDFTHFQPRPEGAAASGHGGLDFFPLNDFVESILNEREPVINVHRATDIAAAGICSALSVDSGSAPVDVPNFRPGPHRASGQYPHVQR